MIISQRILECKLHADAPSPAISGLKKTNKYDIIPIIMTAEDFSMNGMTRREREITDINEIIKILDESKVLHLGLVDGDEPYVVPMNYGYTLENGKLTLWLHGAKRGRKLDVMRANPKVFFEMECGITPFEGEIACKYGITYASVMGKGIAEIVEDIETKKSALSFLMKTQTGKVFEFEDKMADVVSVIRIDVSEFTAKHRPAPKK